MSDAPVSSGNEPDANKEASGQTVSEKAGVVIPEEFQNKVHALVHKATKHHLHHISDRVNARLDELRQEEAKAKGKNPKVPDTFSTEGMPSH